MSKKDYYSVLGLTKTATDEEIKKVKWVELSELKDYLTTNLNKKVAEYLKNRF